MFFIFRWSEEIHKQGPLRRPWKERNARVFWSYASTLNMVVSKIKEEVALWSVAGAKALNIVTPRE
jgi:hypothetical protein